MHVNLAINYNLRLSRTSKLLLRLDSETSPGLTEAEFEDLLVRCRKCKKVVARRVRMRHHCATPRIVIDLTGDDSDSDQPTVIDLTLDSDDD